MKAQPGVEISGTGVIRILSVSPSQADHDFLERAFSGPKWELVKCHRLVSALRTLRSHRFEIVLCEAELLPGTWRELLDELNLLPHAPYLIVASPLADERLWSEALHLGAYDVLAKPFDSVELSRTVSLAGFRRKE